eukprot:TRINITY_DN326_c0_g1_i1.p1 TRINITY_DN326_c0_g1~~TRINITY_DN326_c0_g1_i1.p1  ORF type:complete len:196 (-),score=24.34 TRINITY_DN326_c0_g1_i1:369-956(-)
MATVLRCDVVREFWDSVGGLCGAEVIAQNQELTFLCGESHTTMVIFKTFWSLLFRWAQDSAQYDLALATDATETTVYVVVVDGYNFGKEKADKFITSLESYLTALLLTCPAKYCQDLVVSHIGAMTDAQMAAIEGLDDDGIAALESGYDSYFYIFKVRALTEPEPEPESENAAFVAITYRLLSSLIESCITHLAF